MGKNARQSFHRTMSFVGGDGSCQFFSTTFGEPASSQELADNISDSTDSNARICHSSGRWSGANLSRIAESLPARKLADRKPSGKGGAVDCSSSGSLLGANHSADSGSTTCSISGQTASNAGVSRPYALRSTTVTTLASAFRFGPIPIPARVKFDEPVINPTYSLATNFSIFACHGRGFLSSESGRR